MPCLGDAAHVIGIRPKRKKVEFPLTDRPYFIAPNPTDFVGKVVDTELKGPYKTAIPPNRDCKSAGHVEQFWRDLMERVQNEHFNQFSHEITYKI